MDLDDILPEIGEFGRFQQILYYVLCIPASLPAAFQAFNQVFISATPDHWCRIPELEAANITLALRKNISIPLRSKDGVTRFRQCEMYNVNFSQILRTDQNKWTPNLSWPITKCKDGWEYDNSDYDSTLVTDLNLVCEDNWWPSTITSAFYVGSLFGNIVFGWIADKFGRRISFFIILFLEIIFAIAAAFSPDHIAYMAFRVIVGFTFPAIFQIPFVLGIEIMSPAKRTFAGIMVCVFFAFALALLAMLAFLLRNWYKLALATSVPFLTLFTLWWVIPESPRWLLSQNKIDEAEVIIQKIAKTNKKKIPKNFLKSYQVELLSKNSKIAEVEKYNSFDLIRTPNMRKKTLIITFNWLANAVVYNGLSYNTANLGVSDYLAFFIAAVVELPAYFLTWYALDKVGRRWPLCISMMVGGVACICTMAVPEDMVWITVTLSTIGKFGIAASFSIIYIFAGELYPTVLRALGLGISSFVAGIGLIASPYIVYLAVYSRVLPLIIMGALSVAGAIAAIFLPETLNTHLPQTIAEGEEFGKNIKIFNCHIPQPEDDKEVYSALNEVSPNRIKTNGPESLLCNESAL